MPTTRESFCSVVSQKCGEDSAGSAGIYDDYFFVSQPLPWARKVWASNNVPQRLQELSHRLENTHPQIRIMGIVADHEAGENAKIIHYQKTTKGDLFSGYERYEYTTNRSEVADLIESLVMHGKTALKNVKPEPNSYDVRELFICTHGSRDVCCGKLGFPIYDAITREYARASSGRIKVWRVSHTGGHRFAPTLLDFPTGMYWGRLSLEHIAPLMKHSGDHKEFKGSFRGNSAFGIYEQIADRELFLREGWRWLSTPRRFETEYVPLSNEAHSIIAHWKDEKGPRNQRIHITLKDRVETLKSTGQGDTTLVPRYTAELEKSL